MGKTTNILDLNNRLTKVEKENVAQNSYTSLKNKPKINNVMLTGNKSLADLGAAAASDLTTLAGNVGDKAQLTTADKSSTVAAINEVDGKISNLSTGRFRFYPVITSNNYAAVNPPKANHYSIDSVTILGNSTEIPEATGGVTDGYRIVAKSEEYGYLLFLLVGSYADVNKGSCLNIVLDIT